MSSSAAFARRQKERARKQAADEKRAKRAERREQKEQKKGSGLADDPMNDPSIDWSSAVRHTPIPDAEESEASKD